MSAEYLESKGTQPDTISQTSVRDAKPNRQDEIYHAWPHNTQVSKSRNPAAVNTVLAKHPSTLSHSSSRLCAASSASMSSCTVS